jgi:hypothetical protein
MWRILPVLLIVVAGNSVGCGKGKEGGPGADKGKGVLNPSDDSFTLTTSNASLAQGESKTTSVGIKRGKNFDQDVKLSFSGVPAGVSIKPAQGQIKKSETETNITIEASREAALGTHDITVTGKPSEGKEGTNTFQITVKKP